MIVAIPSKGRPHDVRSLEVIPSAAVFVPEGEERLYRAAGVKSVVPVPREVRGITKTRNWILDYAKGEGDPRVVMVDDDVKACGYFELGSRSAKQVRLTEAQWLHEWERLFDLAEDLKFRIWGVATDGALRSVYPWKPFLERSYVTASCMGMRADLDLRFDESFQVKEDYELTLRCMVEDGGVLAARYLFWSNDHWGGKGGCAEYRTQGMERAAVERLIAKYPGMIRRVTRGGSEFSIELDYPVTV